jgi:hypothetical protein
MIKFDFISNVFFAFQSQAQMNITDPELRKNFDGNTVSTQSF